MPKVLMSEQIALVTNYRDSSTYSEEQLTRECRPT